MSNFSYVAFAFNRIALIGKDHIKLVDFMSKMRIKRYLLVTGIISLGLSVVKGFKYHINYVYQTLDYPFSNENDIKYDQHNWTDYFYFIVDLISDSVNYVLFVIINLSIDVYMLFRLKMTLNEKKKRFDERDKKMEKKKQEMNEAMNNAIKMVMVNSTLNFCLKLPLVIIPFQNVIMAYYYKNFGKSHSNYSYDLFLKNLIYTDFLNLIANMSEWLFSVLISIQLFVYLKFDKKLKTAFDLVVLGKKIEKANQQIKQK